MSEAVAAQVRKATSEATLNAHPSQEKVDILQEKVDILDKVQENGRDSDVFPTENSVEDPLVDDPNDFPDGGLRAWLVVLGTWCATFATFGFVNSWGVFQSYYEQDLLSDTPPSTIAWIGSIQYALVFLPGLVAGRLFDMGIFRMPLLLATLLVGVCSILTAQCTEYWQFLLCQGLGIGLGCGFIFGPVMSVLGHWFKKRRSLALGIMATGSSTGGTVIPIAARNLIRIVGFPWTMRILGFILLFVLSVTNLTMERRLPLKKNSGPFVNLKEFKNPVYSFYCAAGFFGFLGIYTVLTYVDISATSVGIPDDFSFYLVSIANAGSGAGRLFAGAFGDRFGPLTVMTPFCLLAAVLTYAWPFITTKGGLIALALFYGFASGAFVALLTAPIMEMGNAHDVGRRVGMAMTIFAIGGLCGPPISGAINTHTGSYQAVGYYAGTTVLASVVLMLITRHLALGGIRGKF